MVTAVNEPQRGRRQRTELVEPLDVERLPLLLMVAHVAAFVARAVEQTTRGGDV
jgi:hypothetical protein